MKRRAMFFIDGFNLYHSLDENPSFRKYKWLNLWELCRLLLLPNEDIADVFYFTAYTDWNAKRKSRHHAYVKLNESQGCTIILGKFQEKPRTSMVECMSPCLPEISRRFCGKKFLAHEEKMTDVNIAVNILKACAQDSCDAIYLLSGDNDLVPALETARELRPDTRVRVLLPPNAKAKKLMSICKENGFKYTRIREEHLAKALFPNPVIVGDKTYTKPLHWA